MRDMGKDKRSILKTGDDPMSLAGVLLGLINIAIYVAILLLIGAIVVWLAGVLGYAIPAQVQKIYMLIVVLVALYMIVALLLGIGLPFRVIGHSSLSLAATYA